MQEGNYERATENFTSTHYPIAVVSLCSLHTVATRAGAMALIAILLGAPAGLAAATDLLSIAALPLVTSWAALAALLRWQLVAMRAMWRLLRGRGLPFRPWGAPRCARRPHSLVLNLSRSLRHTIAGRIRRSVQRRNPSHEQTFGLASGGQRI